MASKQQQAFKMYVRPYPRYLTGGDTHILCVACLGEEHAQSALESTGCEHCDMLPLRTLLSRLAFFCEDAQACVPQGSGPAVAEAQQSLRSWGSQMDLSAEVETGTPYLCLHLTDSVLHIRVGKHALWFLLPRSRHIHCSYLILRN